MRSRSGTIYVPLIIVRRINQLSGMICVNTIAEKIETSPTKYKSVQITDIHIPLDRNHPKRWYRYQYHISALAQLQID